MTLLCSDWSRCKYTMMCRMHSRESPSLPELLCLKRLRSVSELHACFLQVTPSRRLLHTATSGWSKAAKMSIKTELRVESPLVQSQERSSRQQIRTRNQSQDHQESGGTNIFKYELPESLNSRARVQGYFPLAVACLSSWLSRTPASVSVTAASLTVGIFHVKVSLRL